MPTTQSFNGFLRSQALSSRNLAKHGLRRGAYDGANRRRHVLFESATHEGELVEIRREFDTKGERDEFALTILRAANK